MRTLLILLLLTGAALGSPFLVCDSYPASTPAGMMPTGFQIKGLLTQPLQVGIQTNADGSVQLHWDMHSVGFGTYTAIVDAISAGGISVDSAPITWITDASGTRQVGGTPAGGATPVSPVNVQVSPQ